MPNLPDTEKCQTCPNNQILLEESPWLARIYCQASADIGAFVAHHQQCLACGLLGLTEKEAPSLVTLSQAFDQRRFK